MSFRDLVYVGFLLCFVFVSQKDSVAEESDLKLNIVFFTPSDIEPPEGVKERMKQIIDYTQNFYKVGMRHWGYDCENPLPVKRDKEGFPKLLYVKGTDTHASGKYDKLGFQPEVIRLASKKYNLPQRGQVFWIFMHKGPETRWGRGGGTLQRGGVSTAKFFTEEGEIKLSTDLADGFLRQIMLKGAIHELGHAVALPHIGPRDKDKLGNSLMGPVNKVYDRKDPKDRRVYLSEASAAMLWKHPLFSGTTKDRNKTPKAELLDFKIEFYKEENSIVASGKLKAAYPAHRVVIANKQRTTRSDYWLKCFVGEIKEDGSFTVNIDEFDKVDGEFQIVFCFDNGAVMGENSKSGIRNAFKKSYQYKDDQFILN